MALSNKELVPKIYKISTQIHKLSPDKQEGFIQACIAYSTLPFSVRHKALVDIYSSTQNSLDKRILGGAWIEISTIVEKENSNSASFHITEAILRGKHYDIYLNKPHIAIPSKVFSDLIDHNDIAKVNAQLENKDACFLNLNLSLEIAVEFFKRLHNLNVRVEIAPLEYRQPRISIDDALPIAEKAIKEKYTRLFPTITNYENPERYRDEPMHYTFASGSEELHKFGLFEPDAVFVSIDKIDGHVWAELEYSHYMITIGLGTELGIM